MEYVEVKIPKELYDKIKKQIEGTDFKSVEEFIIYTLETMLEDTEEVYLREDEEKVKKRLKALGYI
ncbi:MAG: CopG family transcriptional regulator [Crenarchaeota archaeon]|nr:CopG family transcriptional regulator [Thermoproteota archaeon]MCR8454007.1 CopG family transcriptional regulator [Thermoproteota archaeon]MCR8463635.1 CopG family transcriptional regulator [Thermoproteota archaeon]MCR8471313.1 CopG family transcriptional regulator [Thermoproteota archaeon]MCR8472480.1 CopG family transcriptional regulator [Thermoproteota archaeon]